MTLLSAKHLRVRFEKKNFLGNILHKVDAVSNVSFDIQEGETLGLVGESGSGKTTIGRALTHLVHITSGNIVFNNKNVSHFAGKDLLSFRKNVQMLFQNPDAALNPRFTVYDSLKEGLQIHYPKDSSLNMYKKIVHKLENVQLSKHILEKYPHELSGGQKQRICIARALLVDPQLIILDEPVSALDVSVQAHILNLLKDLQDEFQLTYLFISHDLNVVKFMSDRIIVLYQGKIVEQGTSEKLFANPMHPYTKLLLSSIPGMSAQEKRIIEHVESKDIKGCSFASRCSKAKESCFQEEPDLQELNDEYKVSCHYL